MNYLGIRLPSKHAPFTAADTTELRQDNISLLPPRIDDMLMFSLQFLFFCGLRDKSHISPRVGSHQSVLMNQTDRRMDGSSGMEQT